MKSLIQYFNHHRRYNDNFPERKGHHALVLKRPRQIQQEQGCNIDSVSEIRFYKSNFLEAMIWS